MKNLTKTLIVLCLFFLLSAESCDESKKTQQDSQNEKKLANVESLMAKQPTSIIPFSMDRYLLDQRNTRFNDPTKMSYLYIVLLDGTWLKVTIIGKLASTSKRLTKPEEEYRVRNGEWPGTALGPAPDEMGTYGHSEPSKVGMTTLGSLIEFGGFSSFIYSETPLMFQNLKREVIEITTQATPEEKTMFLNGLQQLKKQAKQ